MTTQPNPFARAGDAHRIRVRQLCVDDNLRPVIALLSSVRA
jgi:hypothetical protein